jgi:hypothetical protein
MNSMRICDQLWGATMAVAAGVPQRLTTCKDNPSNLPPQAAAPSKQFYAVVRGLHGFYPAHDGGRC